MKQYPTPFRRVPAPLIRACCRDCRRHHEGVQRPKPVCGRRRANCVRRTAASFMMKRRGDALSAYYVTGRGRARRILEVTLVNLDNEWFGYVGRTRRFIVNASMLHDLANTRGNPRLLLLVAAF